MNPIQEDILMHYGVKRRSGRYPWGSGDDPYQHSGDFYNRVKELKDAGMTEKEIVDALGLDSTTQLRTSYSIARNERDAIELDKIKSMLSDGKSVSEISRQLGLKESSIRSKLNSSHEKNIGKAKETANILKKALEENKMIDIGKGVNNELGISREKLESAAFILEAEGYKRFGISVPQATNPGKRTTYEILANPDYDAKYAYNHTDEIGYIDNYHSDNNGDSYNKIHYPSSIDSSRIKINYAEDGGTDRDGVIELRRGVPDLDLGNNTYSQVRILVDGTHYLKGMAIYSDNIPDGADVVFNTNKTKDVPMLGDKSNSVLKPINTDNPDDPFGAYIKANGQSYYTDSNGERKLSAINKIKEEGDWEKQSKTVSSQFLSKQPIELIEKQLSLTYSDYAEEFDKLKKLDNPVVKQKMLIDFADNCDSALVHLKAMAFPRQKSQVILPLKDIPDDEVYAPNYRDGEKIALIRYPHGGTFEIPVLTVNNKNKEGKRIIGPYTIDAVGISHNTAMQLSGADFDGDSVTAIPVNRNVRIEHRAPLEGLKGFDPSASYPKVDGMRVMTKADTQKQMGVVSNLITDMTIKGATEQEIVRAVKHSMVVIDAHKHELNYKQSERDNGIEELRKKYQINIQPDGTVKYGGASTLLSKRKTEVRVPETRGQVRIDPETGKYKYKESGRTYIDEKGNRVLATKKVPLLQLVDDANEVSSGSLQEKAYAKYINNMKKLANDARKEAISVKMTPYNPEAKKKYSEEVERLDAKLKLQLINAPKERKAQALANSRIQAKTQANPSLKEKNNKKALRKLKQLEITNARAEVGRASKEKKLSITPKEWEAIQSGAISSTKLREILRFTDNKVIRDYAMPKESKVLSEAKINKIKSMKNSGYTVSEIADSMNISTSSIYNYLK